MTKFKVGQKWLTRGGDISTIRMVKNDPKYPDETGLYVDDGTYRYPDGSFYDGETNEEDLVTLIELGLVLQIIDANPATPTGHEKEGENRG
jgi:hypothetical protein